MDEYAEQLERELADPESYAGSMEPHTLESLRLCARTLREAAIRLHRADWLLSGDDGEDSYHKRLADDLVAL
jgi:hypothetical protein